MNRRFSSRVVAFAGPLLLTGAGVASGEKVLIEKLDDLPRRSFAIETTASDLIASSEQFTPFAAAVRTDLEELLAAYQIADATTLTGIHGTLLLLDLIEGRYEAVGPRVRILRDLEDKPGPRLVKGLSAEATVAAVAEVGSPRDGRFLDAYRREYSARVAALPWLEVQETLEGAKGQLEMLTPNLLQGVVASQIDPIVAQSHEVGRSVAMQLIGIRFILTDPTRETTVVVLTDAIERNRLEKPDIWAERSLDLSGRTDLAPVSICIWDTGVETEIYRDRLLTNPGEVINGKDDDGNGHLDDVHGIAYDEHWNRTTGELFPMDGAIRSIEDLQGSAKGLFDLQAAVDSDEARMLRELMATTPPEEMKDLMEDLGRYTLYAHGTHVAGIALEGNPAARLLYCRLTGDPRAIPSAPTMEDSERAARAFREVVDYCRANQVRVVNMSWVIARSAIESGLEANGVGATPEERKAMSREMFDVTKEGLRRAFESAPEILFVGGAGNSDNDVSFDEFVPPMFDLPNLLIAGAVDRSGDATGFTSVGPTVRIYSNGFEVESYVPGGERIAFSGTSMASPNVANLAAKLIALRPALTPPQVIALILEGAEERTEGDRTFLVMNPRRSAELLVARYGS